MRRTIFTALSLALVWAMGCDPRADSGAQRGVDSALPEAGLAPSTAPGATPGGPSPRSGPSESPLPSGATMTGPRLEGGSAPGAQPPPPSAEDEDADGDGQSAAEGDCDEADPAVYAEAPERCNGEDDDCDGEIDEPGAAVTVHVPVKNEGAVWTAAVELQGCAQDPRILAGPPPTVARCGLLPAPDRGPLAHELRCELVDDGALEVIVEVNSPDGRRGAALARGAVTNVPPVVTGSAAPVQLILEPEGEDSGLGLADGGAPLRRTFRSLDLGALDAVRWSVEGAPPGLTIRQDGVVRFNPSEADLGAWRVVVLATDDDGGSGELAFTVDVARADDADGGLGCCCFGATAALVLPLRVLLRRRQRRQPTLRSEHVGSSCEGCF